METMRSVMGHFHQATRLKFNHPAAGSQCTSISLFAIIAATRKDVDNWGANFIDKILIAGDDLHLSILRGKGWPLKRKETKLDISEIPPTIQCEIDNYDVTARVKFIVDKECYVITSDIEKFITSTLEKYPKKSFILRMFDSSVAIIYRDNKKYSVFDPHSRNRDGLVHADGSAGIFHFDDSTKMIFYLKQMQGKRKEQIDMNPVSIDITESSLRNREIIFPKVESNKRHVTKITGLSNFHTYI